MVVAAPLDDSLALLAIVIRLEGGELEFSAAAEAEVFAAAGAAAGVGPTSTGAAADADADAGVPFAAITIVELFVFGRLRRCAGTPPEAAV